MGELISIIVPVYNVEDYMVKCIDSLIEQSYNNLEIILVDDGSTDKSGIICDEYAEKEKRITVIHKENGGLSDARNFGIKASSGKYLCFVDSDDYLEKDTVKTFYETITKNDAEISICNMIRVFEDDDKSDFYKPTLSPVLLNGNQRFQTLSQPSVCNKMFKASLFSNVEFPVGKYYEDTYVYHILLYKARKVVLTGQDGYFYRCRKTSILGDSQYNDKYFDFIEAVWYRLEFLLENNVQPYADDACLSYYAALATADKHIPINSSNRIKFKNAHDNYIEVYKYLIKQRDNVTMKQRIRLFILRYFPKIHSIIY